MDCMLCNKEGQRNKEGQWEELRYHLSRCCCQTDYFCDACVAKLPTEWREYLDGGDD